MEMTFEQLVMNFDLNTTFRIKYLTSKDFDTPTNWSYLWGGRDHNDNSHIDYFEFSMNSEYYRAKEELFKYFNNDIVNSYVYKVEVYEDCVCVVLTTKENLWVD